MITFCLTTSESTNHIVPHCPSILENNAIHESTNALVSTYVQLWAVEGASELLETADATQTMEAMLTDSEAVERRGKQPSFEGF